MRNNVELIAVLGTLEVGCGGPPLGPPEESRAKDLYRIASRFQGSTLAMQHHKVHKVLMERSI